MHLLLGYHIKMELITAERQISDVPRPTTVSSSDLSIDLKVEVHGHVRLKPFGKKFSHPERIPRPHFSLPLLIHSSQAAPNHRVRRRPTAVGRRDARRRGAPGRRSPGPREGRCGRRLRAAAASTAPRTRLHLHDPRRRRADRRRRHPKLPSPS